MTRPPSRLVLTAFTVMVCATSLRAQAPAPTPEQLKSWIEIRQQRVQLLRDEVKQIDARIEARTDELVATLKSITDSKDSRTKVARMKEDTGKKLMKAIEYYDQKRAALRQEVRSPKTNLTPDEKERLIAAFDEKIDKRTRQIIELNKSMPTHKDYDRYKATGGGWYGTEYQRNEDYEQNRRMTSNSNKQRDAIVKQLDASIAALERMGRALRTQLNASTDPAQQKARAAEIEKNDALIAERRTQRVQVLKEPGTAAREVPLKEAMDLDQAIKRAIDDLRRDFTTLFERYHTLLGELTALHTTEASLAAAEKPHGG